jgi:hypothetical protein
MAPLRIRTPLPASSQKPAWQRQYDEQINQTDRWLLSLLCAWLLLMLYVGLSSGGDRLILVGFLLWTGIGGLLAVGFLQMLEMCCSLHF